MKPSDFEKALEAVSTPHEEVECDGHNWEIGQVRPEWTGGTAGTYREIALVICTFCGVVRKTIIKNL